MTGSEYNLAEKTGLIALGYGNVNSRKIKRAPQMTARTE
jgi:hypothetical protein